MVIVYLIFYNKGLSKARGKSLKIKYDYLQIYTII